MSMGTLQTFWLSAIIFTNIAWVGAGHWQEQPNSLLKLRGADNSSINVITPELFNFIQNVASDAGIPGISLGLVHSDGVVELGAWGLRSEDGEVMTSDTLLDIASCLKSFLATSVGILIDDFAQGKNVTALPPSVKQFGWDTSLADLFPDDWELMDECASKEASIRDILSHMSGLPRHDFSYRVGDSPLDVLRLLRYLRPAFHLRQKWSYNNQMYMVGAHIVSTYSGMSYMEFIKTRIFNPLNMSSTTFSVEEATRNGKLAQGWSFFGRRLPQWITNDTVELNAGPGGIISSTVDLTKWVKMLLKAGVDPTSNTTIIPPGTFDEITTANAIVEGKPQPPVSYSIVGYGIGWQRESYRGHELISHDGSLPGFASYVGFLPDDDLGIVLLSNADESGLPSLSIVHQIMNNYLGLKNITEDSSSPTQSRSTIENDESSNVKRSTTNLTLSLKEYSGSYTDKGYRNITFCDASTGGSQYCSELLKDFAPFEDFSSGKNNGSSLYARSTSPWGSHVLLRHDNGDTFNMTFTTLFPEGFGRDQSPFSYQVFDTVPATFVVDNKRVVGFGLLGTVGEETNRQRLGGSVEDISDVWFVKSA